MKFIAEPIAKGIEARKKDTPLAVIACENAIGATDTLRGFIEEKLSDETKKNLKSKAVFANSAIDRIVPVQPEGQGMNVKIEKFYEWCVESKPFEGKEPQIKVSTVISEACGLVYVLRSWLRIDLASR